ncbi:BamA/TamA family outer membrane protein [Variovorax sp. J22R24]|uniref:BamA/TamA family outer membrane protein n=1 Tax=Variovorax gracilis TaxID=3053502 RepID=UPI002576BA99|nr:BamA/TamA family outer membrane protein [Variovorax sp. J22R24]MDM0108410.1 BamA/TamA family outer membrane protein [Variovorax sp. J22R24]
MQLNPVDTAQAPSSLPPTSEPQDKKSQSTVVPIPLADPTLGSGLAVLGMYFHPQTAEEATTQPPSLTAAFGMGTNNGSYVAGVAQTSYWDADRWRFSGLAGFGHLNLDFFGSGAPSASSPVGVRWTVDAAVLQATLYYRIVPNWYLGGQFRYADVRQTFGVGGADPMTTGPADVRTSGAGALLERDTRDNKFAPHDGSLLEFHSLFNRRGLGGDVADNSINLRYRKYISLRKDLVLATDVHACAKGGDVPLFDYCFLQLRGYPATRYIGRSMLLGQAELRWHAFGRVGIVAFVGTGAVADRFGDITSRNLPVGYGVGVRYMVLEDQRINLRIDVARGSNSQAVYLSVTEAF